MAGHMAPTWVDCNDDDDDDIHSASMEELQTSDQLQSAHVATSKECCENHTASLKSRMGSENLSSLNIKQPPPILTKSTKNCSIKNSNEMDGRSFSTPRHACLPMSSRTKDSDALWVDSSEASSIPGIRFPPSCTSNPPPSVLDSDLEQSDLFLDYHSLQSIGATTNMVSLNAQIEGNGVYEVYLVSLASYSQYKL